MYLYDEECHCGHLKSVHHYSSIGVEGHGECRICPCEKFTWKQFIDWESLCFDCGAESENLVIIDDGVALCKTCYAKERDLIAF